MLALLLPIVRGRTRVQSPTAAFAYVCTMLGPDSTEYLHMQAEYRYSIVTISSAYIPYQYGMYAVPLSVAWAPPLTRLHPSSQETYHT